MLRKAPRLATTLVILGGLLAACGGGNSTPAAGTATGATANPSAPATAAPGGSGGTVDSCALITAGEVQTQTGTTVARTEPGNLSCTWWLVDDGGWIKLVVHLDARALFDAAAVQATVVDGLGDKAFSDGAMLVVLKGDTMLQLGSEIIASSADPAVFTRPLMEAALARL